MKLPWKKRKEEQHRTAANLPSHDDFVTVEDDLDQEGAYRRFGGLSLDEAREKVADNFLCYQEDFMWMGPRAFCYYFPAFVDYFDLREFDCIEIGCLCFACKCRIKDFERHPGFKPCACRVLDGIIRVSALFELDLQRMASELDTPEEIENAREYLASVRKAYETLLIQM